MEHPEYIKFASIFFRRKVKKLGLGLIILFSFVMLSCSSLQAGIYLTAVDKKDGDIILQKESEVKSFLEQIKPFSENYIITAYERRGVSFQIRRTKLLSHSYYVITDKDGQYHTLSFYGTKIAFYSEGAWTMDADSDFSSYQAFIEGKNAWDVIEIKTENGIDTAKTAANIITKIESNIKYYFRDHINNKPDYDNCNTALQETLVEIQEADSRVFAKDIL
jgi:hypothetical protein